MKNVFCALRAFMLVSLFALVKSYVYAQPVFSGNVTFNSQADLNAWNPAFTSVSGSMVIQGADIQDLSPLQNIVSVRSLTVQINPNLSSLNGLNALHTATEFIFIGSNPLLSDLGALSSLQTTEQLGILGNPLLTHLNGLQSLTSVVEIGISNNAALSDLDGLQPPASVEVISITGNPVLTDLSALSGLTSVRFVSIRNNAQLQNLSGLEHISHIGDISIAQNPNLTSLSALSNLVDANVLVISGNNALSDLSGLENLSSLLFLQINDNPLLTDLDALAGLSGTISQLIISNNDALTDIDGLSNISEIPLLIQISGNASLANVNGLLNVTSAGDLQIMDNPNLSSIAGLSQVGSLNAIAMDDSEARGLLTLTNNTQLSDCCPIYTLLHTPGAIDGPIAISGNATGCDSQAAVSAACGAPDDDCDGVPNDADKCPGGDDGIDNNHDGKPDCAFPPTFNQTVSDWRCGKNKVLICHRETDGTTTTICVKTSSVASHLAHGDYLGPCDNAACGPTVGAAVEERRQVGESHALIYPNPASDAAQLDLSDYDGVACDITLMDARGASVRQWNATANTERLMLDLGGLQAGLYFVRVRTEQGETNTLKLTIQVRD